MLDLRLRRRHKNEGQQAKQTDFPHIHRSSFSQHVKFELLCDPKADVASNRLEHFTV
jgi:hypothetical protein